MQKITFLIVAIIFFCGCHSAKYNSMNTSPAMSGKQDNNDGWQLLFDGKTTNGWHTYNKSAAGKVWKIEDGTLHLDAASKKNFTTEEGGDLLTNDEFDNFDLKLEWKISKNGNSGVMIFVKEDAKYNEPYFTGPEMQVLDNLGHPDGKIYKHNAGDLYDMIASTKDASKPIGEWNDAEIISNNGKLDFYLNGEHTISTTMWDDNWRKMVAASKFMAWPDFGTFKKGRIDLQDHGNDVWYRNIKIKKL